MRHRKVFYWKYFLMKRDPGLKPMSGVNELLPPRRQWARPRREQRGGMSRPLNEILRDSIYRKIQGVYKAGKLSEHEWGRRLISFVEKVQQRIAESDYTFTQPIYVVCCDVMKFFDLVNHDVVRREVRKLIGHLTDGERFMRLLDGYLASYNLAWMQAECRRLSRGAKCILDIPDSKMICEAEKIGHCDQSHIGIPQGGALSGTLANIVLNTVDQVVGGVGRTDLFYARYCDDMLFVSPQECECVQAFEACRRTFKDICVFAHPVCSALEYGPRYYQSKSKGPFVWARRTASFQSAMPWVSFLGCCVRFDGALRLREETIKGHARMMESECADLLARARRRGFRSESGEQALVNFIYRLIDKGVGRITAHTRRGIGRCWLAAFPHVWNSPPALPQLHFLDRVRSRLLAWVRRELGLEMVNPKTETKKESALYLGKPFSYAGIVDALTRFDVSSGKWIMLGVKSTTNHDADDSSGVKHSGGRVRDRDEGLPESDWDRDAVPPESDWGRASGCP